MLVTSTPETVNPVADACEAAGVPCLSTVVPWEAWYFGRGAKPGERRRSSTRTTSASASRSSTPRTPLWTAGGDQQEGRRHVAQRRRRQRDPAGLGPLLKKAGYTIVDPGAYEDGTNDYSSQIAEFKKARRARSSTRSRSRRTSPRSGSRPAQQGYRPKIAQIAKTGLFPSQVEALGPLGVNLASAAYWHPDVPVHLRR